MFTDREKVKELVIEFLTQPSLAPAIERSRVVALAILLDSALTLDLDFTALRAESLANLKTKLDG